MVLFGISGCIRATRLFSGKMVVFEQGDGIRAIWLNSGKSGCIRAKVVVFRTKWLYSGKNGCNRERWLYLANVVVFRQDGIILEKRLYSGKIVVFWQNGCNRAKTFVIGQIVCIRAK